MTNLEIKDIYNAINALRDEIRDCYVTKDEFRPIKVLVFGMAGIILSAVVTTLVASVIQAR